VGNDPLTKILRTFLIETTDIIRHLRPENSAVALSGLAFSGGYTSSLCNQPTKSTQPCIPPGSLNRVPASAGVRAEMSALPGGR